MVPKLVYRWLWKSIGLALGLSLLVALSALETLLMPGVVRAGETTRVSVASDGTQGNGWSGYPSISGDGGSVAFVSITTNLIGSDLDDDGRCEREEGCDTNSAHDIFVHDRQTGQTTRVSVASDGTEGNWGSYYESSISGDGRYVAFQSFANTLVPGDTNGQPDIFVHDRQTGQTTRVSVASDGTQGNGGSEQLSISADGRYVAFHSADTNLVPGDTNIAHDIFVHDREAGEPPVEPILTVIPSTLNFGMVRVGKSKDLSFEVQNTGEGTLAGTATASDPFSVVANSSFTVDAGDLVLSKLQKVF